MSIVDTYQAGNSSMRIARGLGCNLFDWRVDGRALLHTPPDFLEKQWDFPLGGNPVLIPSVGRTWDRTGAEPVAERYRISGDDKAYAMPVHGLAMVADWKKTREAQSGPEAVVSYEMRLPEAVRQAHYPFDISLAITYTLRGRELLIDGVVTNQDTRIAPFAYGYHPFFAVSDAKREGLSVHMPIENTLELCPGLLVPTGNLLPCNPVLNLEPGVEYDGGYTISTGSRASIVDDANGVKIHVDVDETFELFVVYSAATGGFVCLEPWSRGLGEFESLREPGWETLGKMLVLRPGESKRIQVKYSVEF